VRTELVRTELVETELVRTELKARVEIRQLEELEVFNSLRLSVVVTTEILTEILTEVKVSLVVYYLDFSVS